MHDLEFDFSSSLKVKVDGAIRKPTYDFLLVKNSKYMCTCICSILGDIATQNMHDLEFDLPRSPKVKIYGVIIKTTYDFLLVNNSKYMPICSILRGIATQICMTLKVEVIGDIRKSTYDFLLVNNSKYMPICSILGHIATQNMHDLESDLSKLMVPLESPHMTSY